MRAPNPWRSQGTGLPQVGKEVPPSFQQHLFGLCKQILCLESSPRTRGMAHVQACLHSSTNLHSCVVGTVLGTGIWFLPS